jgi:uncharacterized delta-60 repeat protein
VTVLSGSSTPRGKARASTRPLSVALVLLLVVLLGFPRATLGAGALDPTFDGDGKVVTDFGAPAGASDIVVQTDGKFVAAGSSGGDFALARYKVDGSLDTSFDGDGKLVTDFGGADGASSVAIQADGKIVVVGRSASDFALARYNTNGSLDTSFSGDGRVATDFGYSLANDVTIQPDGKIVAVGETNTGSNGINFGLARYNVDGSLDTSFDGDGLLATDILSEFDSARSVAMQPDGKIVAGGTTWNNQDDNLLVLARYNPDGSLDPTFDGDGQFDGGGKVWDYNSASHAAYAVAIQPDGKIVTAGYGGQGYPNYIFDFAIARYDSDGSDDTSFHGNGALLTDFGRPDDGAADLTIQADGKILAAGTGGTDNDIDFALAHYLPDGSRDPNFDFDGRVVTDFGGSDRVSAVAVGTGGRIVAAGTTSGNNNADFALARYTSTGTTIPKISVNDVTRFEGNGGMTAFGFKATLSTASSQTITVSAQTSDGSASAASDYIAVGPATIEFAPGETTKTVIVKVRSDLAVESNEGFFLKLSSPSGATIADGQGKGTIQNDDLSPAASCTITGTSAGEALNGTAGNDVICAGGGADRVYGLDGNDVLKGEGGDDLLVGGNGYDLLLGASGADQGQGGAGNDTLWGGDQGDTLTGGINSDALFGELGADSLNTKDSISANDRANGGPDSDSCTTDAGDVVVSCP